VLDRDSRAWGFVPSSAATGRYSAYQGRLTPSVTILAQGETNIAELVWDNEAVEKGTWSSTAAAFGIECGPRCLRQGLPGPKRNQTTSEDVSQGTCSDRSRPESALGKGKTRAEGSQVW